LALSLLQRKPDEWRRQHATPSSGGSANTATASPNKNKNTGSKATAPSAVAEHHVEDPEGVEAGISSPERGRGRKKRKRSAAAADEIDALFDDAIGRKVVRSALEPAIAPWLVKSGTEKANLKQGRGQKSDRSVGHDRQAAELGAVVDAIKVAPRHEGKKRRKRLLDPA